MVKPIVSIDRIEHAYIESLHSTDERTLAQKYGNKSANLIELQAFLTTAKTSSILPLDGQDIDILLQEIDFAASWQKFVAAQGQEKQLTAEGKLILANIRARIIALFKEKPIGALSIQEWLNTLSDDDRNMVRSSSCNEDCAGFANAGGNESFPARCEIGDVSARLGEVIASTISEKSLEQLLLAGFDITTPPFIPVLLHQMVPCKGQVPVSFVMYTSEAEGEIQGLVHVQAAHGHGEGVVENKVPNDSYYVYNDGTVHKAIYHKGARMECHEKTMTDGKMTLAIEREGNSPELTRKPCLSDRALQQMKEAAQEIEAHYGKPMDVEGVYLPETDELYIVQVRPLVPKEKTQPTYLDMQSLKAEATQVVRGSLIGAGLSDVRIVRSVDEIIVCDTLQKALDKKFLPRSDKEKIKAVLVYESAGATSHAATTFRGEGIPVIQIPNDGVVKGLLKQNKPLLIDSQRSLVACVNGDIETAKERGLIREGTINYPIPLAQTLTVPNLGNFSLDDEVGAAKKDPLWMAINSKSLQEKLELISDPAQLLEGCVAVIAIAKGVFNVLRKDFAEGIPRNAAKVGLNAIAACREVLQAQDSYFSATDTDQAFKRILLAKRWLETVLLQDADRTLVDGDAFKTLDIKTERESRRIWPQDEHLQTHLKDIEGHYPDTRTLSEKDARALFTQYLKAKKTALRPVLAQAWETFVHAVAKSRSVEMNQELCAVIKTVQEADIMPSFMQQVFNKCWVNSSINPVACLKEMQRELEASKVVFEKVRVANSVLQEWHEKIDAWSDPELFDTLMQEYYIAFVPTVLDPQWAALNKSAVGLSRTIILRFIERATEVMDLSVKSMKGGTGISDQIKVEHFAIMLRPYFLLMSRWMQQIPAEIVQKWNAKILFGIKSPHKMVNEIHLALLRCMRDSNPSMLFPSRNFSVASTVIGCGAAFSRSFSHRDRDITLEDLFTLMHQNILQSLCAFQLREEEAMFSVLPRSLEKLCTQLKEIPVQLSVNKFSQANLLSIDYSKYPLVNILFNIPLNNHSSSVAIQYDQNTEETTLTLNFFGENDNRSQRMEMALISGAFQGLAKGIVFKEVPQKITHHHSRIVFGCPKDISVEEARSFCTLIHKIIGFTNGFNRNTSGFNFLNPMERRALTSNFSMEKIEELFKKIFDTLSEKNQTLIVETWILELIPFLYEEKEIEKIRKIFALLPVSSFSEYGEDTKFNSVHPEIQSKGYYGLHYTAFLSWYLADYWPSFFADPFIPLSEKMRCAQGNKFIRSCAIVNNSSIEEEVKWIMAGYNLDTKVVEELLIAFNAKKADWDSHYQHPLQVLMDVAKQKALANDDQGLIYLTFQFILVHAKPSQALLDELLLEATAYLPNTTVLFIEAGAKLNLQLWRSKKQVNPQDYDNGGSIKLAYELFLANKQDNVIEYLVELRDVWGELTYFEIYPLFYQFLITEYAVAYFVSAKITLQKKFDIARRYSNRIEDIDILLNHPQFPLLVKWQIYAKRGVRHHAQNFIDSCKDIPNNEFLAGFEHPLQVILKRPELVNSLKEDPEIGSYLLKIAEQTTMSQEVRNDLINMTLDYPQLRDYLIAQGITRFDILNWCFWYHSQTKDPHFEFDTVKILAEIFEHSRSTKTVKDSLNILKKYSSFCFTSPSIKPIENVYPAFFDIYKEYE